MPSKKIAGVVAFALGGGAVGTPVELAFKEFVAKYQRTYATSEEEKARFSVFASNYEYIEAQNGKNLSYTLEANEFADQAPDEFQAVHLGLSQPSSAKAWEGKGLPHLGTHRYSGKELPASVDWTTKGAVTAPKNQGQCGSCWAFSSTGSLEGAWYVATGKLVSLSEQQLVDCSKENNGCNGGIMEKAYDYLEGKAVCTEESYSYTAKSGQCSESQCTAGIPSGGVTGYKDVAGDDENALKEASAQQTVAIAIEADQKSFQLYSGGILSKTCGDKLDHGVLLVGYGTENGMDYWKVKNSWGPAWGENGYIRLERGLPKAGECGIKSQPTYPVVDGSVKPGPAPSPPSPSPPAPGPGPSPPSPSPSGCGSKDAPFCKNPSIFNPITDCEILAASCKQLCGCCDPNPPETYPCGSPSTSENTIVV